MTRWQTVSAQDWSDPPGRVFSKSVWACETESWTMIGFPDGDTSKVPEVRPFRCHMWRCRRCAPLVGYLDAERIGRGMMSLPERDWFYVVLTIDPKMHKSPWRVFRAAGEMWNKGFKRSLAERLGVKRGELKDVQTWEVTKRGWPHVNVALNNAALSAWAEDRGVIEGVARSKHKPGLERPTLFCPALNELFRELADASGFGQVLWSERVIGVHGLAGYLAKTARELAYGSAKNQIPYGAPLGFRRVRGSKGLIPKPSKLEPLEGSESLVWQVCPTLSATKHQAVLHQKGFGKADDAAEQAYYDSVAFKTEKRMEAHLKRWKAIHALESLADGGEDQAALDEIATCLLSTTAHTVTRSAPPLESGTISS